MMSSNIDLKIMTWNATGVMSSASYLCDTLLNYNIDICGLSEHWLYEHNLFFLNSLTSEYRCHAISDYSLALPSNRKIGKGGVAILWHKRLDMRVTPLPLDDDRIIGIQVQIQPDLYMFVFQLYLPCSNHSIESFRRYIDKLYNLWFMYRESGIPIFIGDVNTDVKTDSSSTREQLFCNFLYNTNYLSLNKLDSCN